MNIKEKIKFYKENLDCFDDTMEKYKFLLDQGKKASPFPEEFREDSFKVTGCQAQVWLVPYLKDNLMYFHSDSDAFISKGMVTILCDIFGGNNPAEIDNSELNLLDDLNLNVLLTPGRRNGVYSMLLKIKEHAKSHC
jgi:cysteine desulfuration protein SufE|tara:strand:- start:1138 stop:1548 length:411 start_codon:yes stop_codon:yes gene_type:complete